jgi:isochorismate hydrolase
MQMPLNRTIYMSKRRCAEEAPEKMRTKGRRWLKRIEDYNLHQDWTVNPAKAALLVIDMQNHFVHRDGRSDLDQAGAIVPGLVSLINTCHEVGVHVVFTRHAHKPDGSDVGILGQWWGDAIIENTWDADIFEELAPGKGDKVVVKTRYSAFQKTDLEEFLLQKGVQDIIISGVMTNICCESTAREAFMKDFRVFFLADGTATLDDQMQLSTLRHLAYAFSVVKTIDQVINELK